MRKQEIELYNLIRQKGRLAGLTDEECDLLMAMCIVESGCRPDAVSEKDCKGLFQFADATYKMVCIRLRIKVADRNVFDPDQNIRAAIWYFKYLKKKFGCLEPSIIPMAWNWGEGNVAGVIANKIYIRMIDDFYITFQSRIIKELPKETHGHVGRVMREYQKLRREEG